MLLAWSAGDEEALKKLTPLFYPELHRAARWYVAGERSDHTLQATELIHEVSLRMSGAWIGRTAHIFRHLRPAHAAESHRFCTIAALLEARRRRAPRTPE